jgi:hypothetical protein
MIIAMTRLIFSSRMLYDGLGYLVVLTGLSLLSTYRYAPVYTFIRNQYPKFDSLQNKCRYPGEAYILTLLNVVLIISSSPKQTAG